MEVNGCDRSQRTPSTSSVSTTRSGTVRVRSRRPRSRLPSCPPPAKDDSLTSFPSLSPENSPNSASNGKTRASLPSGNSQRSSKHRLSMVETLTTNSQSFRGRQALFEESSASASQDIPGALHLASDDHIRRLVVRRGAVNLVRQLAEDLAQREAEMSRMRWGAELRERELKKMLREVEVSNLDIETRLHHLEAGETEPGKNASTETEPQSTRSSLAGIGDLVGEALEEGLENGVDGGQDYLDTLAETDRQATIRAAATRSANRTSARSSSETGESRSVIEGWKSMLFSGSGTSHKSRASTMSDLGDDISAPSGALNGAGLRRKGLDESIFRPPHNSSRSPSISSWTKIFGGNPGTKRDSDGYNTHRGRATNGSERREKRNASQASAQTSKSTTAAMLNVTSKSPSQTSAKHAPSPNLGPGGTLKTSSLSVRSLPPSSPTLIEASINLGPVEMDTILPHGTRPPTLTPTYEANENAAGFLTDRFGFIYDQRRRKREAESLARLAVGKGKNGKEILGHGKEENNSDEANEQRTRTRPYTPVSTKSIGEEDEMADEERPRRGWSDYLKVSAPATELLSQTRSAGASPLSSNAKVRKALRRVPTFGEGGEGLSMPSFNPIPAASTITAGNAEIAKPIMNGTERPTTPAAVEVEPVKLLLAQLTDLHDKLQREKTIKWNEFMRKVRAERRKEGETVSNADSRSKVAATPEAVLADGEMIGVATLGNKGKVGRTKYREFRMLVLAGIPVVHRAKVWSECSGALALRIPGYYGDLASNGTDDPVILTQIQMDINRTLTDNVFFRQGPGVGKLHEVLLAYSRRNPEVGYCQGMNLITASLLLIMPTAEDAFWVLVSMIENILPRHYYDNSLLTSRADQQVLRQYVTELLPRLSAHLEDLSVELEALTFQWFLSLFTDCLSAEALYRVWDVLLCCKDEDGNGGSTFLFQVALALLKLNESQLLACTTPGEIYTYLGGEITNHAISIDGLIRASEGLKTHVRRVDVEERRAKWVAIELETIKERENIKREGQLPVQVRTLVEE